MNTHAHAQLDSYEVKYSKKMRKDVECGKIVIVIYEAI